MNFLVYEGGETSYAESVLLCSLTSIKREQFDAQI